MKYVFGPVPSRRLGLSLGIDPVPPKTCNFNCIYCQLGRTANPSAKRKAFFSACEIMAEIASTLDHADPGSIDWITFVGSGETTLFSRLGSLIRFVKTISPLPVAVITNGSTLFLPEVQRDLSAADAVLPSLDAGRPTLFSSINRPRREFSFDRHVEGLISFSEIYTGQLWVEVMLLRGINDSNDALTEIASVLEQIEPHEIHISTPSRPPAEEWVEPPCQEALDRAASIFGGVARVLNPITVDARSGVDGNLDDVVLKIVTRHPLQEAELVRTLENLVPGQVLESLTALAGSNKLRVIERYGKRFWCSARANFPDQSWQENTPAEPSPRNTHPAA
jgi:wyosine [tRNA(Phe)-imidazoG37] synthetase (radical SAM superfamily)